MRGRDEERAERGRALERRLRPFLLYGWVCTPFMLAGTFLWPFSSAGYVWPRLARALDGTLLGALAVAWIASVAVSHLASCAVTLRVLADDPEYTPEERRGETVLLAATGGFRAIPFLAARWLRDRDERNEQRERPGGGTTVV